MVVRDWAARHGEALKKPVTTSAIPSAVSSRWVDFVAVFRSEGAR